MMIDDLQEMEQFQRLTEMGIQVFLKNFLDLDFKMPLYSFLSRKAHAFQDDMRY